MMTNTNLCSYIYIKQAYLLDTDTNIHMHKVQSTLKNVSLLILTCHQAISTEAHVSTQGFYWLTLPLMLSSSADTQFLFPH